MLCGNNAVSPTQQPRSDADHKGSLGLFSLILFLSDSDAFDYEYGILILRMNHGLDMSHIVEEEGQQ